jgi:hypothetical protein
MRQGSFWSCAAGPLFSGEQDGFTARGPNIPAYGEGATEDEAIADFRKRLFAYVEEFALENALAPVNASRNDGPR